MTGPLPGQPFVQPVRRNLTGDCELDQAQWRAPLGKVRCVTWAGWSLSPRFSQIATLMPGDGMACVQDWPNRVQWVLMTHNKWLIGESSKGHNDQIAFPIYPAATRQAAVTL
jgi:hypothetical protein